VRYQNIPPHRRAGPTTVCTPPEAKALNVGPSSNCIVGDVSYCRMPMESPTALHAPRTHDSPSAPSCPWGRRLMRARKNTGSRFCTKIQRARRLRSSISWLRLSQRPTPALPQTPSRTLRQRRELRPPIHRPPRQFRRLSPRRESFQRA